MSTIVVFIYLILSVGFVLSMFSNDKKSTHYLKFPLAMTFIIYGILYRIYPDQSEKLDGSFNDNDIFFIFIIFSPVISALLISFASPDKNINKVGKLEEISSYDRSMSSLDEAKKAEFKGEWQKAIGLYQDTLYYLKNDYKELSKKGEKEKQAHIYICEESIRVLANRK